MRARLPGRRGNARADSRAASRRCRLARAEAPSSPTRLVAKMAGRDTGAMMMDLLAKPL
ncbi:MAG: hypothetical protein JRN16_01435 [Nitrososphaerota archaeon]|nr:hypothetical protein [Nitrososphaerota archaeon]MDG6919783.1 hypothetical protein [Nitrososphaerota archaeon]MDG6962751.1 hypothetical protein [Nitrososphaerota archaeon]MDG6983715.1 hypothetical protein [Nitrososphaerota archaeon]MDG7027055.1 hypothetical protein [Nitrososphaerota archaeon]